MVKEEDLLLVERFQKGEKRAYELLVEKYRERIYRLVFWFTQDRDFAFDLCQEIFLRVWFKLPKFKKRSSFYTWLYRIALNLCIDAQRKKVLPSTPFEEGVHVSKENPAKEMERKKIREDIEKALTHLPPRQRMVFFLQYVEEIPQKEIARALGISKGAVKANAHQAIKKMREYLKSYRGEI